MTERGQDYLNLDLNPRSTHSAPIVGDKLFVWAGAQMTSDLLLNIHDFSEKKDFASKIDVFHLPSGQWFTQSTTVGSPPCGTMGYCCTVIGSLIYYFGGYCDHNNCFYNSITCLDTLTMEWSQLLVEDERNVMKRGFGEMIAVELDGVQHLLTVGGEGSTSGHYHPQFGYKSLPNGRICTNEINLCDLSTKKWTIPTVNGQPFPPISGFAFEKVNNTKGIIFGGFVVNGGSYRCSNDIYIIEVSQNVITLQCLSSSLISRSPQERWAHASTVISNNTDTCTLVSIGGVDIRGQPIKDNCCWLLDIKEKDWSKIDLPQSVTLRHYHSLSAYTTGPNCVWLVVLGGITQAEQKDVIGSSTMKWVTTPVMYPNIAMVIELVFEAGHWSVGAVLNSYNFFLLELLYKKRTKAEEAQETLLHNLQLHVKSLGQELLVSQINKESLQEELLDIKKQLEGLQSSTGDNPSIKDIVLSECEKTDDTNKDDSYCESVGSYQKQHCSPNEKERVVHYSEVSELPIIQQSMNDMVLEEQGEDCLKDTKDKLPISCESNTSLQVSHEFSMTHKHNNEDWKTITELRNKITERDILIAKLMKSQHQQNLSAVKETDYSMKYLTDLNFFKHVHVAGTRVFLIEGDSSQSINWEEYGINMTVSKETLLSSETAEVMIFALVGGKFLFPKNAVIVSGIYALFVSKPLLKPLKLDVQHCVNLTNESQTKYLRFAIAPIDTTFPYKFSFVDEGGQFPVGSWYGSINRSQFSLVCEMLVPENTCLEIPTLHPQTDNEDENEEENECDMETVTASESTEQAVSSSAGAQLGGQSQSSLLSSTCNSSNISYFGRLFYEEKQYEDLVTFTTSKDLNILRKYIQENHQDAEIGADIQFRFQSPANCIKLIFDNNLQRKSITGWTIEPHIEPCQILQRDVDRFGSNDVPIPPLLRVSVYASKKAKDGLHYSVPLEGVVDPITIFIHRSLRATPISSSVAGTSTSSNTRKNVVQKQRQKRSRKNIDDTDIEEMNKCIAKYFTKHEPKLRFIINQSLSNVAMELHVADIILTDVKASPSYDRIVGNFLSGLNFKKTSSDFKQHCNKFLDALKNVGGPFCDAVKEIEDEWNGIFEMQFEVKKTRLD